MCSKNAQETKEAASDSSALMGESEDIESNKKDLPD